MDKTQVIAEVEKTVEVLPTTEELTTTIPAIRMQPPETKPPLYMEGPKDMDFNQVIGYIFPDGTIGIKASPMVQPEIPVSSYTPVGVVEIGEKHHQLQPGYYIVAIELSRSDLVKSVLPPMRDDNGDGIPDLDYDGDGIPDEIQDSTEVEFFTLPQIDYLYRQDWSSDLPPHPQANASISAEGVCFLNSTQDASGYTRSTRYCSVPGSFLSIQATFSEQFETQMSSLNNSIEKLLNGGYPDSAQVLLQEGNVAWAESNVGEAKSKFKQAIRRDPELINAYISLHNLLLKWVSWMKQKMYISRSLNVIQILFFSASLPD